MAHLVLLLLRPVGLVGLVGLVGPVRLVGLLVLLGPTWLVGSPGPASPVGLVGLVGSPGPLPLVLLGLLARVTWTRLPHWGLLGLVLLGLLVLLPLLHTGLTGGVLPRLTRLGLLVALAPGPCAHTSASVGRLLGCALIGWGDSPRLTRLTRLFCCPTRAHTRTEWGGALPRGSHGAHGALWGLTDPTDRPTDLTGSMCAR